MIILTYNEADQVAKIISIVHAANGKHEAEIIVVDGGSTDGTIHIAEQDGANVVTSERKGRAAQMNKGASIAKHDILYFLHADSIPPNNFTTHILDAYQKDVDSGCFRLGFDYDHWF
ncbi:MAG: glycosyltransferase, partial [Ginsengibacter sp.]